MTDTPTKIPSVLEAFEMFWASATNYLPSSIANKRRQVAKFLRFQNVAMMPADQFTAQVLADWQVYSEKKLGMTGNGKFVTRQNLVELFTWLADKEIIPSNPLSLDNRRKLPKLIRQAVDRPPFDHAQHLKILEFARNWKGFPDWHDVCVVGWNTGMRMSDIAGLLWNEIDLENRLISKIPRKTRRLGKRITVPIEPEVMALLESRRANNEPDHMGRHDLVFPRVYLKYNADSNYGHIFGEFRYLLNKIGIAKRFSFHSYRHAFVSRLLNAGVNVAVISSMTGQSIQVLYGYFTASESAQREALEKVRQHSTKPTP